jgi:SAM-dependent methyltransferase
VSHAGAEFWDGFYRGRAESGSTWTGRAAGPSNVAMHCFSDAVTRSVVAQVGRVVRPGGVFMFHVNALEDRPLRAAWLPARELEPDFVLEQSGQTMHFFSETYLRDLLRDWSALELDWIEIPHPQTGAPYKRVWRGLARR